MNLSRTAPLPILSCALSGVSSVRMLWMGASSSAVFTSSHPAYSCARSSCTNSVIFFQWPVARSTSSMETTCCLFSVEKTMSKVFALPLETISNTGPEPSRFSTVRRLPLVRLNCLKLSSRRNPRSAWMESIRSRKALSETGGIRVTPWFFFGTWMCSNKSNTLLSSRLSAGCKMQQIEKWGQRSQHVSSAEEKEAVC
ncbi:hypothetical protein EYF80_026501 [Liparis tanakae]|uniref:Secreted protein n=1 Tax=Liparis tanakae TaxID=230148 RepID=A0A4Z2HCL6_9TELE|nr:hypothetical protein EYF80_026501 [Liparis tanakae]